MKESLEKISDVVQRKGNYLSFVASIIITLFITVSFIVIEIKKSNDQTNSSIENAREYLSYQLRLGDLFQVTRYISYLSSYQNIKKVTLLQIKENKKVENIVSFGKNNQPIFCFSSESCLSFLHITFNKEFFIDSLRNDKFLLNITTTISLKKLFSIALFIFIGIFFILWIFFTKSIKKLLAQLATPLQDLTEIISKEGESFSIGHLKGNHLMCLEMHQLAHIISEKNKESKLNASESKLRSELEIKSKIASQVAHDIRSPLISLEFAILDANGMNEKTRIGIQSCIRSIKDIANNLLTFYRSKKPMELTDKTSSTLLMPLLESIISRVRYRYQAHHGLKILEGPGDYGTAVNINSVQFQRVISNIIDNSVDAMPYQKGLIEISLKVDKNDVFIHIKDNGKGISPEKITHVFDRGFTFEKDKGSGIGLHHGKEMIESWGGEISMKSTLGIKTIVTIKLPLSQTAPWFIPKISIRESSFVVILDDDPNIHNIWKKKFMNKDFVSSGIEVFNFSTLQEITLWVEKNEQNIYRTIFLCDFYLVGNQKSGLEIIGSLNLNHFNKAILVTSHYDDIKIQKKCSDLDVKIIPKSMANMIPISLLKPPVFKGVIKKTGDIKAIHLDNCKFSRELWTNRAKTNNILFLSFGSLEKLVEKIPHLGLDCQFYIDQDLGEYEVKGEEILKSLFISGYKNLFLTTGFPKDKFKHLDFIAGVIDKLPPWPSSKNNRSLL